MAEFGARAALVAAAVAASVAAGPAQGPARLRVPAPDSPALADAAGPRMVVVGETDTAAEAAAVRARGGRVLAVLGDGALLVDGPAEATPRTGGERATLAWSVRQAVAPHLAALSSTAAAHFTGGVPVVIAVSRPELLESARDRLERVGAVLAWTAAGGRLAELGVRLPATRLDDLRAALAGVDGLVWADVLPGARLDNDASAWRCQSGVPAVLPIDLAGLDGAGQVIAVIDTGLDADSCYFADPGHGLPAVNGRDGTVVSPGHRKVLAVDFLWGFDWPDPGPGHWDDQGHGTHVAGSAAGDGGAWGVRDGFDGMAIAARLVIQDAGARTDDCADLPGLGCPLIPLGPVLEQAYAQGARIHTNSWGDEENFTPFNRYTERTADVDRFVWEHRDAVVLFAAGNAGALGLDTVGSPATGKNVISVGATVHGDVDPPCVDVYSSRGWSQDGRIKPDLVAPGSDVRSARSDANVTTDNCDVRTASGTSMAAPTVAGLAALVRQLFVEGRAPDGVPDPARGLEPSAALVRATLVASAVDLAGQGCVGVAPIPSRDQGWGEVRLDTALPAPGSPRRLLARDEGRAFAAAGEPAAVTRIGLAGAGPLKVVLAWTDPPSSAAAAVNLVNDLDLTVTGPDGTFLGNAFANGVSVTGGAPDRRNNLEVVWLPSASPGTWTVRVTPHAIRWHRQTFALVVTGEVAEPPRATSAAAAVKGQEKSAKREETRSPDRPLLSSLASPLTLDPCHRRSTSRRSSVISRKDQRGPSRPTPEPLTPP